MVNGYLLDTGVVLWAVGEPQRLSAKMREAIERGPVWLSVLTYWEVAIKSGLGKLDVGPVQDWWQQSIASGAAGVLALQSAHVEVVARLPLLHKDPFDRALIGQAIAEGLTLLSSDRMVARYRVAGLQLLR